MIGIDFAAGRGIIFEHALYLDAQVPIILVDFLALVLRYLQLPALLRVPLGHDADPLELVVESLKGYKRKGGHTASMLRESITRRYSLEVYRIWSM